MRKKSLSIFGIEAILLLWSTIILAQGTPNIPVLSCKTWGQPNWEKYENYLEMKGIKKTGARIREYDANIRSITPMKSKYYDSELYLRWLLDDTSIFYDIAIVNDRDEIIFKTVSNQCGLKLPMNLLTQDDNGSIIVSVERSKKFSRGGFNWGISFLLEPMESKDKQTITAEIQDKSLANSYLDKAAFFMEKNLSLDALSVLEYLLAQSPNDQKTILKYWEMVNELQIKDLH